MEPDNHLPNRSEPVWILYGSHTGNCERLAMLTKKRLIAMGIDVKVANMGTFQVSELNTMVYLLIIVSTHGGGEPPPQASGFYDFLHSAQAPALGQIQYSILSLGDTNYVLFCQTGKDFDFILEKLGAHRASHRIDCDLDYVEDYQAWWENVLSEMLPRMDIPGMDIPRMDIPRMDKAIQSFASIPEAAKIDEYHRTYHRNNPFSARILKSLQLTTNQHPQTLHLELDLNGSDITYKPGDAIGIYAQNQSGLVDAVLEILHFNGSEKVISWRGEKNLREALVADYELTPLPYSALKRYAELTGNPGLQTLANDPQATQNYLYGRDVYDLLKESPFLLSPDDLISMLRKNTPRLYSVASSPDKVGNQVDLLISVVSYEALGRAKSGHCSSYLANLSAERDKIDIFTAPNSRFKLPEDHQRPIIMVGSGAGIAPFRGFMQEREGMTSKGKSWLFFGGRHQDQNFYYKEEWMAYHRSKELSQLDLAFSRDQADKIYVQHRIEARGELLFQWLEDGACFFVCGDARKMAADVDRMLIKLVAKYGNLRFNQALEYVQNLRITDRYLTDIY